MAPFSIPAPSIIPLRVPIFGGPKSIDTDTKVELLCDTFLDYEIFYTIDGTKPQPYVGIVQGGKTIKYTSAFCLPPGKIKLKAVAINANIHSMCSSVVTKYFQVLKAKSTEEKQQKKLKLVKQVDQLEEACGNTNGHEENVSVAVNKINSKHTESGEINGNCFEEAFIEFEVENSNIDDVDYQHEFLNVASDNEVSESSDILDELEDAKSYAIANNNAEVSEIFLDELEDAIADDNAEASEISLHDEEQKAADVPIGAVNSNNLQSVETQFCCLKCDMTLQQCPSCKKMSTVSSKFCIECGEQLTQICFYCKEHNPRLATFCHCCGKKLGVALDDKIANSTNADKCVMAYPQLRHAGIQQLPALVSKSTQTAKDVIAVKKAKYSMKGTPRQSPGRGYWHQQLDYICNNVKSHAYNNVEFRKTISEPILCDFQSAHITKDDKSVSVTVVFSPYLGDKSNLSESDEAKS